MPTPPKRLGIYLDDVYVLTETGGGPRISTDRSFLLFICELGKCFDELVLLGRTVRAAQPADYVLPADVQLTPLPHYSNLRNAREVIRATAGTLNGFRRGLSRVDTLWIFGPHPFALALVLLGLLSGKQVVLGVRQDSVQLYEARLASRWSPPLMAVRLLDWAYRRLSRRVLTTVQGAVLERRYGGRRDGLLQMTESVVRSADVAGDPPTRLWTGELELLTVGRIEPEKNPHLLLDALARLDRDDPRFRLVWVGRGPQEEEVRRRACELGLADRIDFRSYVAFGPELLALYRSAHVFVHVSLSEGMPKVLIEALACATPIVATDVGGVRAALDDGRAGLLVPPDDLEALVGALRRIAADQALRERLVERGLQLARTLTLEVQVERVARFMGAPRQPGSS